MKRLITRSQILRRLFVLSLLFCVGFQVALPTIAHASPGIPNRIIRTVDETIPSFVAQTQADDLGTAEEGQDAGGCEATAINVPLSLFLCPIVDRI